MDYYEPSATQFDRDMRELRRRMLGSLAFILLVTVAGIVGFLVIEPEAGFIRAFFMTAITLTTVGYEEEIPVDTEGAMIFTAVLILVGMGATLYFVSIGTAFLLEGQLGNVFRRRRMMKDLEKLEGHQIVCGSGPTAWYTATELFDAERPVVLVAPNQEAAEAADAELPAVPIVVGDATDDDTLLAAGIARAHGLIACSESDNENVVVTLTARQLNPRARIITRLEDVQQEAKARKVGADAVVSPQHIGGLRLASELVRPTVVDFLDTMLRDREQNLRIEQVPIPPGSRWEASRIGDLPLDSARNALLLAVRDEEGRWVYNPGAAVALGPGHVLVFLGTAADARAVLDRLGIEGDSE
ncbi:MAG: potassium channel protein [Gemmatimonadota bacterium]